MTDRDLVLKLIELGVDAYHKNRSSFADPSTDSQLTEEGVATIAGWLEELGKLRLIRKVKPHFSAGTGILIYQVTEEAVRLWEDQDKLDQRIKHLLPNSSQEYDIFLSYTQEDSHIANELKVDLEARGLRCFLAETDISIGTRWEDQVRSALLSSKRILLLITPRSNNRPWLLLETGAAWILQKELIPALMYITPSELADPIRHYQARVIENSTQIRRLVSELVGT